MKNRIRLTESQLHRVIRECVKKTLNEISDKTVWNASYKSDEMIPNPSNTDYPWRKIEQNYNLSDAANDRADNPNSEGMKELVNAIDNAYPYIHDYMDEYDYWECNDLAHKIMHEFKVPLGVAHTALQRLLS